MPTTTPSAFEPRATNTMQIVTRVAEVRAWREKQPGHVGLVPTMGALHRGHLSLVERARQENDRVAVSIFVNPRQFGPGEDLAAYPRDLERDAALLRAAGCDLLLAPQPEEVYPPGCTTTVDVGAVVQPLEGERRPGHFRGVATVVLKLFGIVQPRRAYFGCKDAQQLAVIQRLVHDLDVPVEVVGCPIVREADGLAMSSRNVYLGPNERRAATVLHRALQAAREAFGTGARRSDDLRDVMQGVLAAEPLARADYVSVVDPETFRELENVESVALALLAAFVGRARLIDNMLLGSRVR